MKNLNLSAVFGRFAGKEVAMNEVPYERELKALGIIHKGVNVSLANQSDTVIEDMRDTAKKHGLSLRLSWKGQMGTADYRLDRVNATIEKDPLDGKWRVGPEFRIG